MKNKNKPIPCLVIFSLLLMLTLFVGGYTLWLYLQPQPRPTQEILFEGIEYIRDVRSSPRDIVIHVVKVDLRSAGIQTMVTPGDPQADLPVKASTTTEFLDKNGLQVAINGDGFTPWYTHTIIDYYPHSGDPVDPIGIAASEGVRYSEDTDSEPTLYLSANNKARFNAQIGKLHNAISGNRTLLRNGKALANLGLDAPNPRTAVGLDRANRYLILVVVDGRQPGYSQGVTLSELAEIMIFHGAYNAINLDGGGSSTLAVEGAFGSLKILNSPINHGIPGRQRSVGSHLGIYAKPFKK